jgi:geranylgeranylglycerol-phosphate geranylgeranyltransferase
MDNFAPGRRRIRSRVDSRSGEDESRHSFAKAADHDLIARMPTYFLALPRLLRIHAGITAVFLAMISAFLTKAVLYPSTLALLSAAVLFATSAGNALNDVYDQDIDRVGKPDRPLPSGKISQKAASASALLLFALAIACSACISLWCFGLCIINVTALIVYARYSKRLGLIKNLLIGYLAGSVIPFGATRLDLFNLPITVLTTCAALATISREIIKDIEDKTADAMADARTLPIAIGDRRAYVIAYGCLTAAVAIAFVPYFFANMGRTYILLVISGGGVFLASLLTKAARTRQLMVMCGSAIEMMAFYFGGV